MASRRKGPWAKDFGKEFKLFRNDYGFVTNGRKEDIKGLRKFAKAIVVGANKDDTNLSLVMLKGKPPAGVGGCFTRNQLWNWQEHVDPKFVDAVQKHSDARLIWVYNKDVIEFIEEKKDESESSDKQEKKEEEKMPAERKGFLENLRVDGEEAAYRIAADKLADGAKNLLTLALVSKLGDTHGPAVQATLETPLGKAAIQMIAGQALQFLPKVKDDPRAMRLAKEFRVSSMTTAGIVFTNELFEHVAPMIDEALKLLPGTDAGQQVRIADHTNAPAAEEKQEQQEEETEEVAPKKRAAGGRR